MAAKKRIVAKKPVASKKKKGLLDKIKSIFSKK
jgi:hypothetical protein